MNSRTTVRFRRAFARLPADVRLQARACYRLFQRDPWHRSLRFKRVHATMPIYSVRVGRSYRAVGVLAADEVTWFWIGGHDEYQQLISQL